MLFASHIETKRKEIHGRQDTRPITIKENKEDHEANVYLCHNPPLYNYGRSTHHDTPEAEQEVQQWCIQRKV